MSIFKYLLFPVSLLLSYALQAQPKPDACTLITTAQINTLFGTHVKEGKATSTASSGRCEHISADNKTMVRLEYYKWKSAETAAQMQKVNYNGVLQELHDKNKYNAIYTGLKPFPEGGAAAYILKGEDKEYGNALRMQFTIGTTSFTFDVEGVDIATAVPKFSEAYQIIKKNFQ